MAGANAVPHARGSGRPDAKDTYRRLRMLGGARRPRDQPSATDRCDDYIDVRPVLHELLAERGLSGDEGGVVERMHVGVAMLPDEIERVVVGFVPDAPVED